MDIINEDSDIVVGTHNGPFHADDVLACAILALGFEEGVRVERTRDEDVLENLDVVVDVGGEYEPDFGRFDHHQVSDPEKLSRENGVPFAAAGLVWKKFGPSTVDTLCDIDDYQRVVDRIDEGLMRGVDALDTGFDFPEGEVEHVTLSGVVNSLRPSWHEEVSMDERFEEAVETVAEILLGKIRGVEGRIKAEAKVKEAEVEDGVMKLDEWVPWKKALHEHRGDEEIRFAVYPQNGTWMIMEVPESPESFEAKYESLPEKYRGLRDEELQKKSGVDDAVFVHPNGFCGGAQSPEGAMKLRW